MVQRKSILITGAGSGIGRETAKLFAVNGWLVGAVDQNFPAVRQLAAELPNRDVVPIEGNVVTRGGASALVEGFLEHTGGTLDVLFNCAGVLRMGPHDEIGRDFKDLTIDVNVKGVVNCIDAALPALQRTPDAHIVSMSSTSAEYGVPDFAVYGATKSFVRGLTEALDIEFARFDIKVSAVLVAFVHTPMVHDRKYTPRSIEKLGVKVTPDKVARTVWNAVHGRKTLWRVGVDATALNIAVRLLGSHTRGLYRHLTGY